MTNGSDSKQKGSAHTPTPWRVEPDHDGDWLTIWGANDDAVVEWDLNRARHADDEPIIDADAALIVRAVNRDHLFEEVLSALERLYEHDADYIRINHLGDVHHNKVMRDARAALSKATGKES